MANNRNLRTIEAFAGSEGMGATGAVTGVFGFRWGQWKMKCGNGVVNRRWPWGEECDWGDINGQEPANCVMERVQIGSKC